MAVLPAARAAAPMACSSWPLRPASCPGGACRDSAAVAKALRGGCRPWRVLVSAHAGPGGRAAPPSLPRAWGLPGRTRSGEQARGAGVRARAQEQAPLGSSAPSAEEPVRAVMGAQRQEQLELIELQKPLGEYMTLPASQYSVLDAERIERVDDSTFKCYAHRLSILTFEVCPVLLVRVDEKPDGCCIRLLACSLDGSDIVKQTNDKFSATMENNVSWSVNPLRPESSRLLTSNTSLAVSVVIPPAFRIIPVDIIESAGNQVLSQLLRVALPRFLAQLKRDYEAWASGDTSRKPLGTGEI